MTSGYMPGACRSDFAATVSADVRKPELCNLCTEAECDYDYDRECSRTDGE